MESVRLVVADATVRLCGPKSPLLLASRAVAKRLGLGPVEEYEATFRVGAAAQKKQKKRRASAASGGAAVATVSKRSRKAEELLVEDTTLERPATANPEPTLTPVPEGMDTAALAIFAFFMNIARRSMARVPKFTLEMLCETLESRQQSKGALAGGLFFAGLKHLTAVADRRSSLYGIGMTSKRDWLQMMILFLQDAQESWERDEDDATGACHPFPVLRACCC